MKKFYILTNIEKSDKTYTKWAPVITNFVKTDSTPIIKQIVEYAETHSQIEGQKNYIDEIQTLPIAIKTLSKLNIDTYNCELIISNSPYFQCYDSSNGNYKDYEAQVATTRFEYNQNMFDIIPEYKNDVMEELSNRMALYIDGLSQVSETIIIYQLFSELVMENGVAEIKSKMLNLSSII
jgi:hypothetical protein